LTLLVKNKQKYYTIYLIAGGIIGSGLFLVPYFIQFNYHLVFSLLENNRMQTNLGRLNGKLIDFQTNRINSSYFDT
jgi:hypothetical protein